MAHDHRPHSDARREVWDRRHAERTHHHPGPNAEVERIVQRFSAGGALDLGAGSGRHALWLAEAGWEVTAVDFSRVGLSVGEQEARGRGLAVEWVPADVRTWTPPEGAQYDLILVSFLHLPEEVLRRTTDWLAPSGHLVVVAHAVRNLTEGVGGPSDPSLLYTVEDLRRATETLEVLRCEEVVRHTDEGDVIDVVLIAQRPTH